MQRTLIALSTAVFLGSALAAVAQPAPSPNTQPGQPATQPSPGPNSGTAPGNEGSTGWTGGTGGSNTGTSPHAPNPASKTQHPETVEGVNPQPQNPPPTPSR